PSATVFWRRLLLSLVVRRRGKRDGLVRRALGRRYTGRARSPCPALGEATPVRLHVSGRPPLPPWRVATPCRALPKGKRHFRSHPRRCGVDRVRRRSTVGGELGRA